METIKSINNYIKEILDPGFMSDIGLNGIQVENEGPVGKIAFSVDASLATIQKAAEAECSLLIVHHGFYWGRMFPISGINRKRIKMLLDNNIGLIAYHLPLDAHPELGNNAVILQKLAADSLKPFGYHKGVYSGFIGSVEKTNLKTIAQKLDFRQDSYTALDFGPEEIETVAVVSGSGGRYFEEAVSKGAGLFITGDQDHTLYHPARENGVNILFGGHYQTETFGIQALREKVENGLEIPTFFIDLPTGL